MTQPKLLRGEYDTEHDGQYSYQEWLELLLLEVRAERDRLQAQVAANVEQLKVDIVAMSHADERIAVLESENNVYLSRARSLQAERDKFEGACISATNAARRRDEQLRTLRELAGRLADELDMPMLRYIQAAGFDLDQKLVGSLLILRSHLGEAKPKEDGNG